MTSLLAALIYYQVAKVMTLGDYFKACFDGAKHLVGIVIILVLAFCMNLVCKGLGTGAYVAGYVQSHLPLFLIPALIFLLSAFVSFSTGTSWGTFAIMLGIAIPLALQLNLPLPWIVGAVVSGGVWGDHSSPISDTTVLASLAADIPHVDHVKTQLPYAFLGGALSFLLFLLLGTLL